MTIKTAKPPTHKMMLWRELLADNLHAGSPAGPPAAFGRRLFLLKPLF